jgi:hypothetical protein
MRNVSDENFRENKHTHFKCGVFFFSENLAVDEIMWQNRIESDRA